jgi:hypothetical protein
MVEYSRPCVVLLDLIFNSMRFAAIPYEELCDVAKNFGLEVKVRAAVLHDARELTDWYSQVKAYGYRFRGYQGDAFIQYRK